uniref:caspase family protein n=1 Tax=Trichocoleus desertorum TaxID=1481672 RepID=UPI0025B50FD5|nr:caspase family protein [Trichocoleus desertorum]
MAPIKRRQFLQFAGSAIATLGFSQCEIQQRSLHYAEVVAQNTSRKRALLIGINDYIAIREGSGWTALRGAVNDVEMQRELLVHRFGFQEGDIRLLTNDAATRANIMQEFEDLIKWAKPGDVVVVHYSGHGSTVDDPDRIFADHLNGTIVPVDSDLPVGGGTVDDITSGTLFLLMAALKTENVTLVLDSCYSGGGVRGNLVIRSRPGQAELMLRGDTDGAKLSASDEERDYQQQLLKRLNLSREDWIAQRKQGIAKGVTLVASRRDQEAADAAFAGDNYAGVFTYALTRHLWQQTRNEVMGKLIVATAAKTDRFLKTLPNARVQTPGIEVKLNSDHQEKPTYFLSDFTTGQAQPAEAVVTQIQDDEVRLLLTGVEPQVLEAFGKGTRLTVVDERGQEQGIVEITSRQQLSAQGRVKLQTPGAIQPGAILQERSRVIPPDWKLRIGLDPSLGSEMAIANRELPNIHARIEPLPLLQQEAHYILGRVTEVYHQAFRKWELSEVPPVGSVGLFSIGLEPVPESFGQTGETVAKAIARLQPKFKFLLAARLLKLTLNTTSSRLKVKAAVRVANARDLAAQAVAVRGGQKITAPTTPSQRQIQAGQKIQIVIQNDEARNLYFAVVLFSVSGEVEPLPLPQSQIRAGEAIYAPSSEAGITVTPPLGMAEVMVVFSTSSLEGAIAQLQLLSEARGSDRGEQAVSTVDRLLDDLAGTRSDSSQAQSQERRLDMQQMAALSVTFEITS